MSLAEERSRFIFVDWAGDPGFAFRRGSSAYLVVAAVFTEDYARIQEGLKTVRERRRLSRGFAFHYADATDSLRRDLARALAELPFTARVVVVDKQNLDDSARHGKGSEIVERFVAEAVVGAPRERIEGAVLILDGSRHDTKQLGRLRVAVSRLCTRQSLPYRPRRVHTRPATEEDGLQVADTLAGLVADGVAQGADFGLGSLIDKVDVIFVPSQGGHSDL